MKKLILALASTLFLTTLALAANNACTDHELSWTKSKQFTYLGSSPLASVFIDTKNIKIDKKNKIIEVWVIYAQSKLRVSQSIEEFGDKYRNYGYMKALMRFNYSKNIANAKDYINLNCNGSTIDEGITKSNEWDDIAPNSMNDEITLRANGAIHIFTTSILARFPPARE
jgi:hypothetical protein